MRSRANPGMRPRRRWPGPRFERERRGSNRTGSGVAALGERKTCGRGGEEEWRGMGGWRRSRGGGGGGGGEGGGGKWRRVMLLGV
ncbi:hypothetical protein DAI22_09g028101 [Oryza sativa Japonica Group]|nr:hypothetical protein DAI22_09g028101 [Oryza sativa Japonica Group]